MPSKTKRRALAHAKRAATNRQNGRDAVDALSPRDRPSDEFTSKHGVISRSSGIGGLRREGQLEKLMNDDKITPEQFQAGDRFGWDWIKEGGPAGSCLAFSIRGGGDWHPTDKQLIAAGNYRRALHALTRSRSDQVDPTPEATMLALVIEDHSPKKIAQYRNITWRAALRFVRENLKILVEHYVEVDKTSHRNMTVHTKEAVRERLDPDDRRNPFTGPVRS